MRNENSNAEVSTLQRRGPVEPTLDLPPPPTDWGQALEQPTHLPADAFEIKKSRSRSQSRSQSRSNSVVTSAPRPSKVPTLVREPAPLPVADANDDGLSASRSRSARGSQPRPLPSPPSVVVAQQAPGSAPREMPSAPAAQTPAPAFMQFAGGAAFDPNAIPLPGELAAPIYAWVRRLALQSELASADRLLRDAVAELTSSLNVVIIYAGPDGFYSLGPDGELPKDLQPVLAVGKARRALVGPHSGLIPIATTTETIGVIQLVRNIHQPAYAAADHITMAAIARECAAVMHHLVVIHLQGRLEQAQDKKSLYRPEALDYHRKKGTEGTLAELSPKWIKRAYPMLLVTMLVALVFGLVVRVPTYSSGIGVVHYDSVPVVTLSAGNIEQIRVHAGDIVRTGDVIAKMSSQQQDADFNQVKAESDTALQTWLFDDQDEQARKSLKSAMTALTHASAAVDQRFIRASTDGKISDIYAQTGEGVQAGMTLMSIVKPGTKPEIWAYLPMPDRSRVKSNMTLQVGLDGYNRKRPRLAITSINSNAIGAQEIRREVGQQQADTLHLPTEGGGSYFLVRGQFDGQTFTVGKKTYDLHNGMSAKVEIQIDTKPFLAEVFPLFDKWID